MIFRSLDNELYHYGTPHNGAIPHSGRYEYGSGEDPFQHSSSFLGNYQKLKESGMSETEIAKALNMSTTELRKRKTIEKESDKIAMYNYAVKLKNAGYSHVAIGEKIGHNESYVRQLLKTDTENNLTKTESVANIIKKAVDEQNYIDIGSGSETMLGVTKTRMNTAVQKLEDEGYKKMYLQVEQAGMPGQYTSIKVLAKPDTEYKDVYANRDKIGFVMNNMNVAAARAGDKSVSSLGLRKPTSVDSSRLDICYAEDGGKDKDGVIELRRGVPELSLGYANYAQVRIAVDNTHYLKGMATYADDLPDGIDIRFNTNKTKDVAKMDVLKPLKKNPDGSINWDNPFGATLEIEDGKIIGQKDYIDENGETKLSPINIVRSEGSWNTWSATLASQFLSKQPMALINQQLNKTYVGKKEEFDEIIALTQPEVKKKLLEEFANDCDSSASHLKAAALPGQSSKVILPLTDISDTEVYAPGYANGTEVILVRYPHGGTFEIPRLTVNNKIESGKRVIGSQAIDAIGINSKVAERLSGADFDGDTVVVIPTKNQKIKTTPQLKDLMNFDPKETYGPKTYKGIDIQLMTEGNKQNEMGRISNLITDMTLQGATEPELARAVKHSMVVIDSVKHKLNYKQSYIDNGIAELKTKYQGGPNAGAATLISQAAADQRVTVQKEKYGRVRTSEEEKIFQSLDKKVQAKGIDILTNDEAKQYKLYRAKLSEDELEAYNNGEKIYYKTNETYTKNGKSIYRLQKENKMNFRADGSVRTDAFELSSGTVQEEAYANYANKLKALANEARKEYRSTSNSVYSPSAKQTYAEEVESLNNKLEIAKSNKPYERQAQLIASVIIDSKIKENPDMDNDEKKKIRTQALAAARARTGASKSSTAVNITEKEWEAIQAGAISSNKLQEILENTDMDKVKQFATPRSFTELSAGQINRITSMANSGKSISEIAAALGISTSTVTNYLSDKRKGKN